MQSDLALGLEPERPERPDPLAGPVLRTVPVSADGGLLPRLAAGVDRRILLEAAIQALPFGITLHDGLGACVLANAAALHALPVSAGIPARPPGAADAEDPAEDAAEDVADREDDGKAALATGRDGRVFETCARTIRSGTERYRLTTHLDVTQRHAIERDLLRRAYIDALTGLPNRALIEQSVEELIAGASVEPFALAFIDLDNFKHINDYYSHAAGDALLVKVADRIKAALRDTDMLARVGGDEFVLLLAPVGEAGAARAFVESLAARLKQPFFIDGHEIFASASIGVSLYPAHGASYDTLRRQADSAMYRVKGGVKGGVSVFEETMGRAATARMEIEQRLRLAIRDRRFACAYQPKVDLVSGEIHGVEVLLRWRDDAGMIRAPGDFVALAVELGLINDITMLVLEETVRSLPEIDAVFGPHATLSLNIAARQATDVAFMEAFVAALAGTGCAGRFVVELTEEAFLTRGRFQAEVLPCIRAAGAKVSIDDFGVGYSSLAALAEITADELKIDRSFISAIHERPRSQILLKAITALGHALGMTLVAEGIETAEEADWLRAETGIRVGQGYYFARPMLIDQILGTTRGEARGEGRPALGRELYPQRAPSVPRQRCAVRGG